MWARHINIWSSGIPAVSFMKRQSLVFNQPFTDMWQNIDLLASLTELEDLPEPMSSSNIEPKNSEESPAQNSNTECLGYVSQILRFVLVRFQNFELLSFLQCWSRSLGWGSEGFFQWRYLFSNAIHPMTFSHSPGTCHVIFLNGIF